LQNGQFHYIPPSLFYSQPSQKIYITFSAFHSKCQIKKVSETDANKYAAIIATKWREAMCYNFSNEFPPGSLPTCQSYKLVSLSMMFQAKEY